VGLVSAIFGIVMALGQKELKRLLAYSSVENVGIITMGLGLGALGRAWNQPALSFLGFGGALFHALNHSLFKGLLFFGAGSVLRGTGTGNLERLGGLGKRMPWTAALFVVGAAAISGLPPFNGFAGEFLLYMAGLGSAAGGSGSGVLLGVLVVAGLALVGTLSMAVFARAVGVAFLCEARSPEAERARESGPSITAPMLILAVACVAFGFLGFKVVEVLPNALAPLLGDDMELAGKASARAGSLLLRVGLVFLFLTIFAGALLLFRRWLLAGRVVAGGPTWDCGYARPTARMQYTASSFGAPLLEVFGSLVRSLRRERAVRGFFPKSAGYETSSPDGAWRYLFAPLFQGIGRLLEPVRKLQQGSIHLYVLYMALTLIALLIWKVGMGE
jgi:NADH:ubiquinone oxidoreductase subunit 5 (subunit L)/multisubunit Na+/H+ antiporter MnhA subunit